MRYFKYWVKDDVPKVLDDSNIVTACRYGALILNTTQYMILDLHSNDYSVGKLIKVIGQDFSQKPVIKYHDDMCHLHAENKLA